MSLNTVPAGDATSAACACGCRTRAPRYPSDLADEQWAVLEPRLPVMLCRTPLGGRPETHHRRAVIDGILFILDTGAKWRSLPGDFPPWRTVYGFFARWKKDGVLGDLVDRQRAAVRLAAGRDREPSAGIIDSQSVARSAEGVVPAATSGYDGNKKVNGRKRHILAGTLGLLIAVAVTPAGVQDRDGAVILARKARRRGRRRLGMIFADQVYDGPWTGWARDDLGLDIQIVRRPAGQHGFQVLPRRWVVERSFAWTARRRRCARDYERLPAHHEAWVQWAAIYQMTRRLARITPATPEV